MSATSRRTPLAMASHHCDCQRRWRYRMQLVGNVLMFVVFVLMDVRDLYYKIVFVGPYDTYSFIAFGYIEFDPTPLVLVTPNTTATLETPMASGWRAVMARCDALYGPTGFVLDVLGHNCTLTRTNATSAYVAREVILTSSVRVDAVAWASCTLLIPARRPPLCQTRMVTRFLDRYRMEFQHVGIGDYALPDSDAERELLDMIDLVSGTEPSYEITCLEGFELTGAAEYMSSLYLCGSSTSLRSAVVGHHTWAIRDLLRPMAWLTLDSLKLINVDFSLRQNGIGVFTVTEATTTANDTGSTLPTAIQTTPTNFSSSGTLYVLLVCVDVILMTVHAYSAIEVVRALLVPIFRANDLEEMSAFAHGNYSSIFSRSLYRSRPIMLLTIVSALLSWQLILAAAVIWTWTESPIGKAQAFLSTLRVWALLLVCFNLQWDAVVFLHERWAFRFAQLTYVTTFEVVLVAAAVAYMEVPVLFNVGEDKYAMQHQRLLEDTTFAATLTYANAFNAKADFEFWTSSDVLVLLYGPLVRFVGLSIVGIYAFLVVRMGVLWLWRRCGADANINALSSSELGIAYARLPIEETLGIAIRARSLLRNAYNTELVLDGDVYIRAPNYFDFGIMVRDGQLTTRRGFINIIPFNATIAAVESRTATPQAPRSTAIVHPECVGVAAGLTLGVETKAFPPVGPVMTDELLAAAHGFVLEES